MRRASGESSGPEIGRHADVCALARPDLWRPRGCILAGPAHRRSTGRLPVGMGKRIALLTYGTRGDVEPFLALATALVRAGYQTRLAAPRPFEALAAAHGVPFVGLEGDPAAVSAALTDRAGLNPLAMLRFMSATLYPLAESVLQQAERACLDSDAIVHSFLMTYAGHHLAVRRRDPGYLGAVLPGVLADGGLPRSGVPGLAIGPCLSAPFAPPGDLHLSPGKRGPIPQAAPIPTGLAKPAPLARRSSGQNRDSASARLQPAARSAASGVGGLGSGDGLLGHGGGSRLGARRGTCRLPRRRTRTGLYWFRQHVEPQARAPAARLP